MQAKQKHQRTALKPILVLVTICIVISGLLAAVNMVTAPIIEAAEAERLQQTLNQLLPNATRFIEISCSIDNVTAVYKDEGGSGYAFVTIGSGYKGDITVITATDSDGAIIGISINASGETATVGTKVANSEYAENFIGLDETADQVEVIAGATISSNAVKSAVNTALEAYEAVKED